MGRLSIALAIPLTILLPLPLEAADLGASTFPTQPIEAPASIWSGAYVGAHLGYGTGDDDAREINGPRNYIADFDGAIGGLHLGWQRQMHNWVAGLEIEAGYLGLESSVERDVTGGYVTSGADLGGYVSLSGRLGYLLSPTWLAYGRAGVVAAELDAKTVQTCTSPDLCAGAQSTPISSAQSEDVTWGLLLGAGLERHLLGRWNGRVEYQFMSFRDELVLPAIDGPGWNHDIDVHAIKFGLSYRF